MMKKRQVLLLGNGINLSYNGTAWKELLSSISVRKEFDIEKMKSPMPLQAILLTNNNIKEAMKEKSSLFYGDVRTQEQKGFLCDILAIGFDDILTTNYSYELEAAGLDVSVLTKTRVRNIAERTTPNRERRYLLHTYNKVLYEGKENRIWHIHGESRMPDSMMLGHYWYGNMLCRIKEELNKGENQYYRIQNSGKEVAYNSWVDSFILGDVYILGFAFDYSELDLWWLLNRKFLEKAEKGEVFFYEMSDSEVSEKTELMKMLGVHPRDLGFKRPDKEDPEKSKVYKEFYTAAIQEIRGNYKKTHIG